MNLSLAPMEGVIDASMRRMLTAIGGYQRCVTEFVRVTNSVVPAKVFYRLCPELLDDGHTRSGTPVYVQLLGSDIDKMARSARVAVKSGAPGIDLNFGCPAKIVNRHNGGSALLKQPQLVAEIVSAVRQSVDPGIPVCAKIRLGFDHADYLAEIVDGIADAGANELCIHARTRLDGYKPPAYWQHIGQLQHPVNTRLIVNGEIWSLKDATEAMHQSRGGSVMIGRGGLAQPDLGRQILAAQARSETAPPPMTWQQIVELVEQFFHQSDSRYPKYAGNRTKQWLGYLKRQYPEAGELFQQIKRQRGVEDIGNAMTAHRYKLDHAGTTFVGAVQATDKRLAVFQN